MGDIMFASNRSQGFTLIELLVTITLVGILLGVGLPFTSSWVDGAKVTETESQLQHAIALAKAEAMRNPIGTEANKPVAAICRVDDNGKIKLEVKLADSAGNLCELANTNKALWSTTLKGGVSLQLDNATPTLGYLMFNSRGSLFTAASCPTGKTCPASVDVTVAAGSDTDNLRSIKSI